MNPMPDSAFTHRVIGCAIEVHRELGPGLIESMYQSCLCDELAAAGFAFAYQREMPVVYKGRTLDGHFRLDIIVEDSLVLEIKAVHQMHPIYEAQLMTYLRLSKKPLGLLMNFNTVRMTDGISRVQGPTAPWPPNS